MAYETPGSSLLESSARVVRVRKVVIPGKRPSLCVCNLCEYPLSSEDSPKKFLLTQCYSVRCRFSVDPKADPRDDDNESAGNVCVDEEITHVPLEFEVNVQSGERT